MLNRRAFSLSPENRRRTALMEMKYMYDRRLPFHQEQGILRPSYEAVFDVGGMILGKEMSEMSIWNEDTVSFTMSLVNNRLTLCTVVYTEPTGDGGIDELEVVCGDPFLPNDGLRQVVGIREYVDGWYWYRPSPEVFAAQLERDRESRMSRMIPVERPVRAFQVIVNEETKEAEEIALDPYAVDYVHVQGPRENIDDSSKESTAEESQSLSEDSHSSSEESRWSLREAAAQRVVMERLEGVVYGDIGGDSGASDGSRGGREGNESSSDESRGGREGIGMIGQLIALMDGGSFEEDGNVSSGGEDEGPEIGNNGFGDEDADPDTDDMGSETDVQGQLRSDVAVYMDDFASEDDGEDDHMEGEEMLR